MTPFNFFTGTAAVALAVSMTAPFALAKESGGGDNNQVQSAISVHLEGSSTVSSKNENDENQNDQTDEISIEASSTEADANDNEGDNADVHEGQKHQKNIEGISHALKMLGEKDQNINSEVQIIADEEASSSSETEQAMNSIAKRNELLSVLFGTDYKSVGVLKSTLVTTQNHIDQLTKVKAKVLNAEVKAGIDVQIAALQKANIDAETFVHAHEDSFSVFGWFVKLFN